MLKARINRRYETIKDYQKFHNHFTTLSNYETKYTIVPTTETIFSKPESQMFEYGNIK